MSSRMRLNRDCHNLRTGNLAAAAKNADVHKNCHQCANIQRAQVSGPEVAEREQQTRGYHPIQQCELDHCEARRCSSVQKTRDQTVKTEPVLCSQLARCGCP
eukprot:13410-Heterococcus_DN1.PRE.3